MIHVVRKQAKPRESFEDLTVLENERRPDETSYTVVNKYYPKQRLVPDYLFTGKK